MIDSPILIGMICAVSAIWRNFWQGTTVLKLKLPGAQTRLDGIRSLNVEHGGKNMKKLNFISCLHIGKSMQLHVQPYKLDTEESPRIGWEAPAEYLQVQEVQLCTVFVFASNKAADLEDLEGMIKQYKAFG